MRKGSFFSKIKSGCSRGRYLPFAVSLIVPFLGIFFPVMVGASSGTITEYSVPTAGSPEYITSGVDNKVWYTSYNNGSDNLGNLTTAGSFTQYTSPSSSDLVGITEGPDGNMWYAESNAGKIVRMTPGGTTTEYSTTDGPWGMTTGPDGNLWFTETGSGNKIGKITTSGTATFYTVPTSGAFLHGITAGPDGNLWFAEQQANTIGEITTGAP